MELTLSKCGKDFNSKWAFQLIDKKKKLECEKVFPAIYLRDIKDFLLEMEKVN
jgi:hypothetical protein